MTTLNVSVKLNLVMNIPELTIQNIDLNLLKLQKSSLVNLVCADDCENKIGKATTEHLIGILHLLDHIQDTAEGYIEP